VATLVDYEPFVHAAARTVSVEITDSDGVLRGLVRWRNQAGALEGERRFDSPDADCAKLAQNLSFAVAVQLQLLASSAPEAAPPEPPAKPEPVPSKFRSSPDSTPAPPSPTPPSPAPSRLELRAGIGPFVVFGWAPDATLGGQLLLALRARTFSLQLGFEASYPTRYERDDGSGFETFALAASLAPCLRFRAAEACSVLRLGQVRVQGFGVDETHAPRGLLAEAGLRLAVSGALGSGLEGRGYVEGLGTLSDWTVQLNGVGVFSAPAVVFLAGIDLGAFFL